MEQTDKTAKEHAADLYASGMGCNCDLDNWEPERSTGHSRVCRIHKEAVARWQVEQKRKFTTAR